MTPQDLETSILVVPLLSHRERHQGALVLSEKVLRPLLKPPLLGLAQLFETLLKQLLATVVSHVVRRHALVHKIDELQRQLSGLGQ